MRRSVALACLLVVIAGAAALRLTGLDWLLPSLIEQDAHIPVQVRMMDGVATGAAQPGTQRVDWGVYPHLVARLTHWLTPRDDWSEPAGSADLDVHLRRAAWPVLRVRLVVALLSLLAVPAAYLLARLWLPRGWSLLAAALVATSLLAVQFAAEARAHGAAAGLMVLAVLACVRLRRRGNATSWLLAGAACSLAFACLQSGVATFIPLVVAHVGVVRQRSWRSHLMLLVPAACLVLALLAFYPFVFEASVNDPANADAGRLAVQGGVFQQSKHQIFLDKFNGLGFVFLGGALLDWEPALAAGMLLAAALWLLARRRPGALRVGSADRLVVLSFVLPYALVVGLYQRSYERFLLPLVPFFAVFTTWGVARACELVRRPRWRAAVGALLVVALLGVPTAVCVQLDRARLAPTTLQLAAQWIAANVQPGREPVVMSRSLAPPLFRTRQSEYLDAKVSPDRGLGWSTYQRVGLGGEQPQAVYHLLWMPFPTLESLRLELAQSPDRWVARLPADLCLAEVYADPLASAELTTITAALRQTGKRLARFSPDGDPQAWEVRLAYQDETAGEIPAMAWRVLHARCFGPVIEVYRVPHEAASGPR